MLLNCCIHIITQQHVIVGDVSMLLHEGGVVAQWLYSARSPRVQLRSLCTALRQCGSWLPIYCTVELFVNLSMAVQSRVCAVCWHVTATVSQWGACMHSICLSCRLISRVKTSHHRRQCGCVLWCVTAWLLAEVWRCGSKRVRTAGTEYVCL
jgi:hypothetical protein